MAQTTEVDNDTMEPSPMPIDTLFNAIHPPIHQTNVHPVSPRSASDPMGYYMLRFPKTS